MELNAIRTSEALRDYHSDAPGDAMTSKAHRGECVFSKEENAKYTHISAEIRVPVYGHHGTFVHTFTKQNSKHFPYYVHYRRYNPLATHSASESRYSPVSYTSRKLFDICVNN